MAEGGNSNSPDRGSGGGGRIALVYANSAFHGTLSADAGLSGGGPRGEAGSVVPGNLHLAAHSQGKLRDGFTDPGNYAGMTLQRFSLATDGNSDDAAFEPLECTDSGSPRQCARKALMSCLPILR